MPPIVLDRATDVPLAVQLADALRAAAASGSLRVGDRLPSTRVLAADLAVSRTVTAAAYEQLLAEGWVQGRRGSGTYVTAAPPVGGAGPVAPARGSDERRVRPAQWDERATRTGGVDLRAGTPCVEVLDRAAWRRAWRAAADAPPDAEPDAVGVAAFRAAVVEHLLRHRGMPADPGAVLATSGSTSAIAELAATLPRGARVAVEEPGYQRARWALQAAGLHVLPVPLDGRGLDVAALPAGLAAVYCTPAHQYPLGALLPADRRVALVERARADGFLVIEDDYDGELRFDVAPLPLLASLGPDVVVHLGTVSKILTPTLGAGWIVAAPAVRAALLRHRERTGQRPSRAGQRVFAALAAHGDLARHLRRLRTELGARRAAVVSALGADGVPLRGDRAGAHLVVGLPGAAEEVAVLAAAARRGVLLDGLARHFAGAPTAAGVVLGYAGPARSQLEPALAGVTAAVREVLGRP
ncbi:PLP-dependent aminotransferase family protein [Pseudonocardia sp.]|uniref:MocR-like pyridoxine biosynthesis transcription factor PdxR n=1 Tax=Pseudonocardia sp. TaxID=60912 RepID=UPI003D0EB5D8